MLLDFPSGGNRMLRMTIEIPDGSPESTAILGDLTVRAAYHGCVIVTERLQEGPPPAPVQPFPRPESANGGGTRNQLVDAPTEQVART
jgi:hypothetical protein